MRPWGEFAPAMTFYRCVANQPTRAHRQPLARPTFRTSDVRADAGRLAMERATRAPDVFGLSVAEYAALLLIRRFGGITQGAVAERLGISKASMSVLATALANRGLVNRRQHLFQAWESRALHHRRRPGAAGPGG